MNDPPVAAAQSVSVQAEGSVAVTLAASDVDGDPLTFAVTVAPAHGAVAGTPPSVTYQPAAGYFGADSFTFRATDPSNASSTAVVSVTVLDNPPVANPQSIGTNEDTATAITLTASDPDGGALAYAIVTGPTHGALSGTAPNLTYTPAANYYGPDSLAFRVTDNGGLTSSTATVSIAVASVNDPPVANAQSVTVAAGASIPVVLSRLRRRRRSPRLRRRHVPGARDPLGHAPEPHLHRRRGLLGSRLLHLHRHRSQRRLLHRHRRRHRHQRLPRAQLVEQRLEPAPQARLRRLGPHLQPRGLPRTREARHTRGSTTPRHRRPAPTSDSSTPTGPLSLPYEIEQWNPGGTSVVWVLVPQIDAGSTTDFIWMYFGNPAAPDGQNAPGIWSSSYRGVWHLTNFTDSTGKGHTGTNQGSTTETAPLIGGALHFNGTSSASRSPRPPT